MNKKKKIKTKKYVVVSIRLKIIHNTIKMMILFRLKINEVQNIINFFNAVVFS